MAQLRGGRSVDELVGDVVPIGVAKSATISAALIALMVFSSCSASNEQRVTSTGVPTSGPSLDSHAGVNGSHAWRIRSGQLQISKDNGNTWSNDTPPVGLSADAVSTGQVSPSGSLVLGEVGSSNVSMFCQSAPNGSWQNNTVTPNWVPGYNISGAPQRVSLDFDPAGNARLVMQSSIGSATALISTFESAVGSCAFNPIFSASSLRWDGEVFGSTQNGLALLGPAENTLQFTADSGKTWADSAISSGAARDSFSVPVWNGSTFVVLASHPDPSGGVVISLLTSTDGSTVNPTGSPLLVPESENPVTFTAVASGKTVWTFGSSHEVFESNDLGQTWKTVQGPSVPNGVIDGSMTSAASATVVTVSSACSTQSCSTTTSTWATGNGGSTWASQ